MAVLLTVGLLYATLLSHAAPAEPTITSVQVQKTRIVVVVQVPSGLKKITLEGRAKLGSGTWSPRAVSRLDGSGGEVSFTLQPSTDIELLRVRADIEEPLPSSFYKGTNSFAGPANSGGFMDLAGGPAPPAEPARNTSDSTGTTRDVVESDIWKIRENTLYFFNQYRGLQVIDLTKPDAPVIRGTLEMPAVGEQMYLLDSGHVVLLARDGCRYGAEGDTSRVLIVDPASAEPAIVAELPVKGTIQESRMVGDALYVVSQTYRPIAGSRDGQWEWGSLVSSFDLLKPASPVAKDTLWYSGYGNVINATDRFLFVATQDSTSWWRSIVRCIDIASPDGTMHALSSIKTSGRVPDKFKINLNKDTLTIITENWNTSGRGVFTLLETFSLANPTLPAKLGQLELARGEQLHASRFDGDRVYVVTFFRIDPLWVVDLSDASNPRVVGELHVPGWSTFIQPLGDQLVTIGIDDTNSWKVAVSLFDVRDPARPALLDKVPLGENTSWSEANYDEKAFSILPDAGLLLVPYQGYSSNGYASRVQLIDFNATTLKARGTIEHEFQPRRATVLGDRIVSIDGRELLIVDAANRDKPVVTAETELAWPVNKVFVQGDFLVEIANTSWGWNNQSQGAIRVAASANPARLFNHVQLPSDLPVLGSTVKDGRLYLAQGKSAEIIWPPWTPDGKEVTESAKTNKGSVTVTIFDLTQLPNLKVLGMAESVHEEFIGGTMEPVWVRPGVLTWVGGGYSYPMFFARGAPAADMAIGRPWWGGSGGGMFFTFDVSDQTSPRFASVVHLTQDNNNWWSFSSAYSAGGMIYISHQSSEYLEGVLPPGQPKPEPTITKDPSTGEIISTPTPFGMWVTRYFLDVIDFADVKSPTIRKPVNIPGLLRGVSHNGALIYTVGAHWDATWNTDWSEWLDASAYDGVSASLVTSLPLKEWPHPTLVKDNHVFIGRAPGGDAVPRLEVWKVADTGKFELAGSTGLGVPANDLVAFGNLLAVQQDRQVSFFDASNPAAPLPRGSGQADGCLYYDLRGADGGLSSGLWIPLNDYGVAVMPLKPVSVP